MRAASLPIRIAYAAVALLLGGVVVFFCAMRILPELALIFPELDPDGDGYLIFKIAIGAAAAIASSLSLYELTQPGTRPRKRRGRPLRLTLASVAVVVLSLAFTGLGWGMFYDLLFAVWLTYTVAFTFIRYGVLDDAKRDPNALETYQRRIDT